MRRAAPALLFSLGMALSAGVPAQQAPPASDRSAGMRAAIDRARAEFVDVVAAVSGVGRERVSAWMPKDYKLSHPEFKIIYAVERERGARLANEDRLRIIQAEDRMRSAIDRARLEARRR